VLALERSALAALASRASLRAGSLSLDQLRAGFDEERDVPRMRLKRVGATAVIPIVGYISTDGFLTWMFGGTNPDALTAALRQAIADPEVKDVLLVVDSSGGECSLVTEAAAEIRRLRAIKPITSIVRPCAASAAYWLASQASTVIATASAECGSVGVFWLHYDVSKLNDRIGIKPTFITSDPRKVELSSDFPLDEAAQTHMQVRVDTVFATFIADVAAGRRVSAARVRADYATGRCYGAAESLRRGLVDEIATLEEVLKAPTAFSSRSTGGAAASDDDVTILLAAVADVD
jgi:signal peptide peptidase SppA